MNDVPYRHWPPGLHRVSLNRWVDEDGQDVQDRATLERLQSLALPPAWEHVWASTDPRARVQARGVDSRGRIQYRYSPAAREESARNRFANMLDFAERLPGLRADVRRQLRRRPPSPDAVQVTALAVRLLDLGLFRVGNPRYTRENHTHGLTTLQIRHVAVQGDEIVFDYVGKEHRQQLRRVEDHQAATVMRRLLECGEAEDDFVFRSCAAPRQRIDSTSVNSYVHGICGSAASAKVFRTWGATVVAAAVSAGATFPGGKRHRDPALTAYDAAAHVLGNTPTMARNSYVHPRSLSLGEVEAVRRAVQDAARRHGSDAAHKIFVDESLQETIRVALAAAET